MIQTPVFGLVWTLSPILSISSPPCRGAKLEKVSTDVAYSKSSGGVGALVLGGGGNVAGGGGAGYGASSGAMARTQRTLTIIIRFKAGVVNEISYHTSSF